MKKESIAAGKSTPTAREKLLGAAIYAIRERGYADTAIGDLCAAAGVSKGAFFHHFASKEQLAIAAVERFQANAVTVFESEPHQRLEDPVDRLLGYVEQRRRLLRGELPEYTCLLGALVQETYETHPAIREACCKALAEHREWLEVDIREALRKHEIKTDWTAKSLAAHMVSVVQGALILAKAQYGTQGAIESIDHLKRYLEMIFGRGARERQGAKERRGKRTKR